MRFHPLLKGSLLSAAVAVLSSAVAQSAYPKKYDINVSEAEIRTVFESIAAKAGLGLDFPATLTRKLSVSFNNKTLEEAIQTISRKARLKSTIVDGIVHVKVDPSTSFSRDLASVQPSVTAPQPASEKNSTSATTRGPAAAGRPDMGGDVKVVRLNFAKASVLAPRLVELFGKEARIVADDETNSLMLLPLEGGVDRILNFVSQYDQMPQQVLIEAQIIETSSNFAREIGVSWGNLTGNAGTSSTGAGRTIAVTNPTPGNANLGIGLLFGSIDHQKLEANILAAENKGEAKIISKPKVVTGNRIAAVIESGISYHVKTLTNLGSPTGSQGASNLTGGLSEVTAGLTLNVLPEIVDGNLIKMRIDIVSSEADQGSSVDGIPGIIRSGAKTTLIIREGITATIGGLVKYSNHDGESGVPFLSSIPWIGSLFKSSTHNHQNNELMIFITPHLLPNPGEASNTPGSEATAEVKHEASL